MASDRDHKQTSGNFYKILALMLLFLLVGTILPALAIDAAAEKAKPFGMMSAFIYNPLPWVVGIISDMAIYFKSLSKVKNFQTSVTGLVLSFGGIWFTWLGVGGMQLLMEKFPEAALYAIAVVACILVLSACKIIAYWVINEKFPPKKTMLLYLAGGAAMTAASFAATKLF